MSTQTTTEAATAASTPHTEAVTPPRTRWAAIVWGVLFAAVAATSMWLIAADDRRSAIADWALTLTPVTISTLMILTIGVLVLATGASALLRTVQRRTTVSAPRPPHSSAPSVR
ncbi:hypothetical protein [Microbacterium sp. APC 3901]|uniref:hypothetical protein n=1 Tax=Microbacterium sp. APC 3901 TaxID=3035192 RepID=UPI0025B5F624|nr:hypothetical protein [Microbacterium sp. APC 3901]MDN3445709.1 hypothetical protein [Microbacterium sp. APC 3901]